MIAEWQTLHTEMLAGIKRCLQSQLPEAEQVECAYGISRDYWQQLKSNLAMDDFKNSDEEVDFFRNIKPTFTCYIEYFTMVYSALVLKPKEGMDAIRSFWEKEETRLTRFIEKNKDFADYYRSGRTCQDMQYFVRDNYDPGNFIVSKLYDRDVEVMTSHDHMVANLLAQEMYREYVMKKLKMFNKLPVE